MAHYMKFNRASCGHMWKHYERAKDENGEYVKFGSPDIDTSRTHQNYNLGPTHMNGQGGFVKERCSEVKMQNRKDVNVMCSWVVTAPKEIQADEAEKFFRETYKFLSDKYGKENVISAYVHMDEVSPHMHFAFVPVVEDKKKNILKVSAKEAVTKRDLETFHLQFSNYMEKIFGRDVGVLNEATKYGNKSIKELKSETAKKELEEIKEQTEAMKSEDKRLSARVQRDSEYINTLESKKTSLEKEIIALESKFKGKQMTADKLNQIKPEKDFFGNIKNITVEDIENLKRMAITTSKYQAALNNSNHEIERLEKENADLKSKVPTLKSQMARNEKEIKLIEENKSLKYQLDGFRECISRLPDNIYAEFEKVVNIFNNERRENRNKGRDMDYEIGD